MSSINSFGTLSYVAGSRLEPHLVVTVMHKHNRLLWIFLEPHGERLAHEVVLQSDNKGNRGMKFDHDASR
jgi:hypothetical protein